MKLKNLAIGALCFGMFAFAAGAKPCMAAPVENRNNRNSEAAENQNPTPRTPRTARTTLTYNPRTNVLVFSSVNRNQVDDFINRAQRNPHYQNMDYTRITTCVVTTPNAYTDVYNVIFTPRNQ